MPYYAPVPSAGQTRFTTIEETALLQVDTPMEDFAYHYFRTRYDRLKGILVRDFDTLNRCVYESLLDAVKRQSVALPRLRLTNREPMAWSMNWFRLRQSTGQVWNMDESQKKALEAGYDLIKHFDECRNMTRKLYIFCSDDREMVLVAMSMTLED